MASGFVLGALVTSTYCREYASVPRVLRPRTKAILSAQETEV